MASFIGQSGYHLFFTEGDNGVVVDSRVSVVVASGLADTLDTTREWSGGEFTELDEAAAATALSSMSQGQADLVQRLYTIPRGVQKAVQRGLSEFSKNRKGVTPGDLANARTLVAGGQITALQLGHLGSYFNNPDLEPDTKYLLNGGDSGAKWVRSIISNAPEELVKPAPDWEAIESILDDDPEASPEFIARVARNGDGIDRLYQISLDGESYVWDGNSWTDLGIPHPDIWAFDRVLDAWPIDSAQEEIDNRYTHILIDPESAIQIAESFSINPLQNVFVEDINSYEYKLTEAALAGEDWELIDSTLTAAGGTPGDGIYTEEERSENASKQVRDGRGQFAKVGGRVMVNGDASITGKITRIDSASGNVEISLATGGVTVVPAKNVETVDDAAATIPGRPQEIPRVDFSGLLGEPRTPINRTQGQVPGTLPQMSSRDLHAVINNFPAWVKAQRDSYSALGGTKSVGVQGKNSLNTGKMGAQIKAETGKDLLLDAYDHPLLNEWLRRKDEKGLQSNKLWWHPITSAAEAAPGTAEADDNTSPIGDGQITPDTSDVKPIYLAIVSPDDPRAVLKLVSLVPAGPKSNQPMTYARVDGEWTRDPQTLNTLNSATPPPVVPLDDDSLNEVLRQVDTTQGVDDEVTEENQFVGEYDAPGAAPTGEPEEVEDSDTETTTPAPVAASADLGLMVLWGPRKEIMAAAAAKQVGTVEAIEKLEALLHAPNENIRMLAAKEILDRAGVITAAGGLDRNRGGAEKLRRYWTKGPGAAKIRWGTPGDWTRCVRHLSKYMGPRAKGYCALRHHEVTGMWTGDKEHRQKFAHTTGGTLYSTSMVASSSRIQQASQLRIKAEFARLGLMGITASALPQYQIYDTKTRDGLKAASDAYAHIEDQGGAFFIPLALPEGIESGDGRMVEEGAATIRDLPISLLWQIQTDDGHKGAVVVGRIERLGRTPKGIGGGYGHFDTGVYGREAERMVRNKMLRFVSADMDMFEADEEEAAADDKQKTVQKKRLIIDQARVMAVTIVAKPAFQEATIQFVSDAVIEEEDMIPDGIYVDGTDPLEEFALVAAGYVADAIPLAPPSAWFQNPNLTGPTPLTVEDDGRVFGHIAAWDMDHIGMASNTKPPRSKSNYAYFHSGVVRTEEGEDVPVGQLTLAGGHAGLSASFSQAIKHYDDTKSSVADLHAGEDKFGIWVAGSLRPGTTPEQIRALRASAPSGDWRPIRGRLELVAVCQVNVPGFPIARTMVASGQVLSLVAAGALPLAKMKSDPYTELAERLAKLENAAQNELAIRASALRESVAEARARRDAVLSSRAESLLDRMKEFGYVPKSERSEPNFTEFVTTKDLEEKKIKELLKERGEEIPEDPAPEAPRSDAKYTPDTQPRDYNGQFRTVLARLKEDLGVSGNQGVIDKLKETENYAGTGDYAGAVKSALDLKNTLDRLDDGALNAESIANVRKAAGDLSSVIANLPLPFDNQAAKIRFSDLPPALRDLVDDFITRVEDKIGSKDAKAAVAGLKAFKSGSDLFSQSEISSQMNKLLRLLT